VTGPQTTTQDSASTDRLIREWLFRFGLNFDKDVVSLLPLWLETFGGMNPAILERLFNRALRTCKFFPKVSEILEPLESAEKAAAPEAAEEAWRQVLEIRRLHWNPDMRRRDPYTPTPFERATAALSERVAQAARAAGVWRDFDSVADLHTWAKKRFIESFIAWGELEQDKFLLPEGEVKELLAGVANLKALPAPAQDWIELHARGLAYADELRSSPSQQPDLKRAIRTIRQLSDTPRVIDFEGREKDLRAQAELIRQKYPAAGAEAKVS
jgi:hypothetical protein